MRLLLKRISLPLASFALEIDVELEHRVTVLFGPSGAGKTSLLDLIAGLRRPASAFIQLDGQVLTDTANSVCVPTRLRGLGYVPQDLALFPHLNVRQNVLFGSRHRRSAEQSFTLERVCDVLEIQPLLERRITDLSGGEQQRVAFARALLASPRMLLLDEPLGSLDLRLRAKLVPYLARVRNEFKLPMLYVTHDRMEALALADEIVVMVDGRVVQSGPPDQVFSRPASMAVAGVVAVETVQPARIVQANGDLVTVALGNTNLIALSQDLPARTSEVFVCIRAEDVILVKGGDIQSSARNRLSAVVRSITREGPMMRLDLDCGFPLIALLTKQACEELDLQAGARVFALIKAPHIHLIAR